MQTLLLTTDGDILRAGAPAGDDVLGLLSSPVELAPGFSLRSFFALAQRRQQLGRLSEFFPPMLERAKAAPARGCAAAGVEYLELTRVVEMIGFPGKPRMEIYTALAGVAREERREIRLHQIEDLLDVPLRLGPLRHVVLGDEADVFEFQTVFTLFEFVEGVTWELSFHGAPAQCQLGR
jgi:hypothetical protein